MSFWDKFRQKAAVFAARAQAALRRFMQGRYGADQLSLHLLIGGFILYILSLLTGFYPLSLLSAGMYGYTAWRMLSRDTAKRAEENRKYLAFFNQHRLKARQTTLRLKNRKEYKYFRCPNCHAILRMKRGTGLMHVTCSKCKHQFDKKA